MQEFKSIYLAWKERPSARRYIVGKIDLSKNGEAVFTYDKFEVEKALPKGFAPYTEFPDVNAVYSQNVLEIFSQRISRSIRRDIDKYYQFWEVDQSKTDDIAYMLAHTQGLLPSDKFEFLADFEPVEGLRFLTDLAGLSHLDLEGSMLDEGDELEFELETSNEYDDRAVVTVKDRIKVGYIKRIHCHLFHKPGAEKLRLRIKALEKNGKVKNVFVVVYSKD